MNQAAVLGCRVVDGAFRDVDFDGADLSWTFLGLGAGPKFDTCSFSAVMWPEFNLGAAVFEHCTFSSVRGRAEPGAASFAYCALTGRLDDHEFRQGWKYPSDYKRLGSPPINSMQGVDLSGAVLRFVDFKDLDLSQVVLDPQRQKRYLAWESHRSTLELQRSGCERGPVWDAMTDLIVQGIGQAETIVDFGSISESYGADVAARLREILEVR